MPDPVWPGTLPQYPLRESFRERLPETVIEAQPDFGPALARQRFTAAVRPISCEILLKTDAQKTTLEAFIKTDLKGRALPFTWAGLSAVTGGGTGRFRLASQPDTNRRGVTGWIVPLELIRLP
jgi:hypothetical protein